MENYRIYTINDLLNYKDTMDKLLKEKIPNFSKTIVKEAPNPWGWSPLANIEIFIKPSIIYKAQILHCGSTNCFDTELKGLIESWLASIETEEYRIQKRNDQLRDELAFSVFRKELASSFLKYP
jgi:hypothetical protein